VRLNHEAREFRWTTVDEALAMPINQPTRKLFFALGSHRAMPRA
jgi:hypothetical protein